MIAFAHGGQFRPTLRQLRVSAACRLPPTIRVRIATMAGRMTDAMYEAGGVCTECGVMLERP
ncbi:hypothetical protein ACVOMT_22365 [Sphingomonas panni]